MPTPGSHAHDLKQHRREKELKDQGLSDADARARARREMAGSAGGPSPGAMTDRARGPLGERGGGGDPGAVIGLRSPAFSGNTLMPSRHGRDHDNVSPPLEWDDAPAGTVELVLWCEDRDAPEGSFIHWLATGIDPGLRSVAEGEQPPGSTVWPNDFGAHGYDGPAPPPGDEAHRYFFEVFALDAPLDVDPGAPFDQVRRAVDAHKLASGTLIGLFAR